MPSNVLDWLEDLPQWTLPTPEEAEENLSLGGFPIDAWLAPAPPVMVLPRYTPPSLETFDLCPPLPSLAQISSAENLATLRDIARPHLGPIVDRWNSATIKSRMSRFIRNC